MGRRRGSKLPPKNLQASLLPKWPTFSPESLSVIHYINFYTKSITLHHFEFSKCGCVSNRSRILAISSSVKSQNALIITLVQKGLALSYIYTTIGPRLHELLSVMHGFSTRYNTVRSFASCMCTARHYYQTILCIPSVYILHVVLIIV